MVDNCTNNNHDFTAIADATLQLAAKRLNVELAPAQKKEALQTIKELSAYDDVPEGLQFLKDNGFKVL